MKVKLKKQKNFDITLFAVTIILLVIGNIMVLSASGPSALSEEGNSYFYFTKQLIYSIIGVVEMLFLSRIDYKNWHSLAKGSYILSVILLVLVLLVGEKANGAKRWINLGFVTLQPSEIVKFALIIFYAWLISNDKPKEMNKSWRLIVAYGIPLAIIVLLLYLEPHKSAIIIIAGTIGLMLIFGGLKVSWIIVAGLIAVAGMAVLVFKDSYSITRIFTFLDPWQDPLGDGYQIIQSFYAIASGGLFGKGLGNSIQKHGYIPEAQNDFIISILAEELGFVGVMTVIILFAILIWKGIQIAMKTKDNFGSLLAGGITVLIAIQVVANLAVVSGSMPVTGIPMPFFSYGGSAITCTLAGMGILLNISRHTTKA